MKHFIVVCLVLPAIVLCAPPGNRDTKYGAFEKAGKADNEPVQIDQPKIVKKRPDLVKLPNHLEGVPIERDGKLNRKFREEAFLGKDNHLIVDGIDPYDSKETAPAGHKPETSDKDADKLLEEVFHKADVDKNSQLSGEELENWIIKNTQRHLDESIKEAQQIFKLIDQDENNVLSWEEYHYHFLVGNNLMSPERAKHHKEDEHGDLKQDDQDRMADELEEWREADRDGAEGLSPQEFLHFRHPEHGSHMLEGMVRDIITSLDKNNDGRLSRDEFVVSPEGEVDESFKDQEKAYMDERRKEFNDVIDKDKDGFVTKDELLDYSNPRNPHHSKQEARELLELADDDENGQLSLDEVLAHKTIFQGSSVLHPEKAMHDEF